MKDDNNYYSAILCYLIEYTSYSMNFRDWKWHNLYPLCEIITQCVRIYLLPEEDGSEMGPTKSIPHGAMESGLE